MRLLGPIVAVFLAVSILPAVRSAHAADATLGKPQAAGAVAGLSQGGGIGGSLGGSATPDGYLRTSKLIGSDVYGSDNTSIGGIDDLLLGAQGKAPAAVISIRGFLGLGNKLVEVPFSRLKMSKDGHLTLAGATKDSLTKMPSFSYSK